MLLPQLVFISVLSWAATGTSLVVPNEDGTVTLAPTCSTKYGTTKKCAVITTTETYTMTVAASTTTTTVTPTETTTFTPPDVTMTIVLVSTSFTTTTQTLPINATTISTSPGWTPIAASSVVPRDMNENYGYETYPQSVVCKQVVQITQVSTATQTASAVLTTATAQAQTKTATSETVEPATIVTSVANPTAGPVVYQACENTNNYVQARASSFIPGSNVEAASSHDCCVACAQIGCAGFIYVPSLGNCGLFSARGGPLDSATCSQGTQAGNFQAGAFGAIVGNGYCGYYAPS